MLWACFNFPALALNLVEHGLPHELPLVIEITQRQRRLVLLANAAACEAGIVPGMSIPTAQGLAAGLTSFPYDEKAEAAALQALGHWAYQFTPHIQCHGAHSLLLEVSRSLRLFQGEQNLAEQMLALLPPEYRPFSLAFCDTAYSAVLGAHAIKADHQPRFFQRSELGRCRIQALSLDIKHLDQLRSMGISTVAQLLALPRDTLARRFGTDVVVYLNRLEGRAPDILPTWSLPDRFSMELDFLRDVEQADQLIFPLKNVVSRLSHFLGARQCATTQLPFVWILRHGQRLPWTVALASPVYRVTDILPILQLKLSQTQLPAPVVGVQLEVTELTPLPAGQGDLLTPWRSTDINQLQLVDRLKARLGHGQVTGLALVADRRPEHAWQTVAPGEGRVVQHPTERRPFWLLRSPQPLRQKKDFPVLDGYLQLLQGPERVHCGWWDQSPVNRDYYVARQQNGRRIWIYRDRTDQHWYLHGIFGV